MHFAIAMLIGTSLGVGGPQGAPPELPPVNPKLNKIFAALRSATAADDRLFEAIKNSDLSKVKAALSAGATPQNKRLPILEVDVTEDQNVDILKLLIKSGANPNQRNDLGWTPLTRAVGLNGQVNLGCAKYLLANGADPNYPGPQGNTPLHTAVRFGSAPAVKLLLASGAKVRMKASPPKLQPPVKTPPRKVSDVAASVGNLEMMNILLKKGANVNAKSKSGRTPLHNTTWAGFGGPQLACVEFLLASGADPQAKTKDGLTPAAFLRKKVEAILNRSQNAPTAVHSNQSKLVEEANKVLIRLDPTGAPIKVQKF